MGSVCNMVKLKHRCRSPEVFLGMEGLWLSTHALVLLSHQTEMPPTPNKPCSWRTPVPHEQSQLAFQADVGEESALPKNLWGI